MTLGRFCNFKWGAKRLLLSTAFFWWGWVPVAMNQLKLFWHTSCVLPDSFHRFLRREDNMWQHTEAKSTGEDQKPAWVSLAFQNIFLKRYSEDHWPLQQTAPWWSKRCCCRVLILKKSVSDQTWFCIRNENRTLEEGNERNYLGCIIEKTEGVEGKC